MILIADSGSTKTHWRLIDQKQRIFQFSTQGINPYFMDEAAITSLLQQELLSSLHEKAFAIRSISFYGAGCGTNEKKAVVRGALNAVLPAASVVIESDLLGAAHALLGKEKGIAAILGTGSNSCLYDGTTIIDQILSKGFIFGDEGSGADLGRTFIAAYLNNELPQTLRERLEKRFDLDARKVLHAVYKEPMPNRYLAGFSKFIYQNLKEPFCHDLVVDRFRRFFEKQVCVYDGYEHLPFCCTGSVAFYYSNQLRAVAVEKGVNVKTITESPIAGLTLYHLGED